MHCHDPTDPDLNKISSRGHLRRASLAPVGMAGLYGRRGEVQAARAAAAACAPFCLAPVGICSVEEVASAGTPPWFQLYVIRDRGYMRELLARARPAARC